LTIINIGSSVQQRRVLAALPIAQSTFYSEINLGPVCAFNNQGVNSTIQTFDNKQAANAAGFLVLHCGSCGACSSWRNLKALWQSRNDVPNFSLQCGKETISSGGFRAAIQCHEDVVGFDEACSTCWVQQEICARDNCAFMYLQSYLTDHMANFPPGRESMTLSDCEMAECSARFLPCAGANRMRMNLLSGGEQMSDNQQCQSVQIDWKELFSTGESEFNFN
jgi:hypothetical protein